MNLIPLYEELFKKPDHTTLEHSCPRSLPFSFLAVGQIGLRYIPVFVAGTSYARFHTMPADISIEPFKAFNEGIRLKDCIRMQQKLMNVRVRCVAADSIYANNANRKFCTKYGISTSFVRKGRAAKDESLRKVLRSELSKERATRLEGSFGTQKQHYSLSRIKARNRKTEILWIFFGIHTANAILMIDKVRNRALKAA